MRVFVNIREFSNYKDPEAAAAKFLRKSYPDYNIGRLAYKIGDPTVNYDNHYIYTEIYSCYQHFRTAIWHNDKSFVDRCLANNAEDILLTRNKGVKYL